MTDRIQYGRASDNYMSWLTFCDQLPRETWQQNATIYYLRERQCQIIYQEDISEFVEEVSALLEMDDETLVKFVEFLTYFKVITTKIEVERND